MGPNSLHQHGLILEADYHFESVFGTFEIEDDAVTLEEADKRVSRLQFTRRLPSGSFDFCQPSRYLAANITVLIHKLSRYCRSHNNQM